MKKMFLLSLIFGLISSAFAGEKITLGSPTANAGVDQTIYLTQTSGVILNGSGSSGDSYQWSDVSTDYKSSGIITSPSSATTTLTGLTQGIWYYQIAVTSGGVTATDIVVIRVDYDVPPSNGTYMRGLPLAEKVVVDSINGRRDTTNFILDQRITMSEGYIYIDRDRMPDMMIDSSRGKLYSTVEDGYQWHSAGYSRAELDYGLGFTFDTTKTYVMEWKGYFPQDFSTMATNLTVNTIMQVHPGPAGTYIPFGFFMLNGIDGNNSQRGTVGVKALYFADLWPRGTNAGYHLLLLLDSMVKKTHTIRLTMREGADAPFLQVTVDGVQKYLRTSGSISITPNQDYPKFATVYDYNNALVDANNHTRGRKFSLVTESFKVYLLNGGGGNTPPTANAGSDQAIILPANSVTLSGSGADADGTISSYTWTKISGPSAGTIINAGAASTTVTGLVQGVYQFQLKVTDNSSATDLDTVQITVILGNDLLPAINPSNTINGLDYKYYEDTAYNVLPTFNSLIPVKTGTSSTFDISLADKATAYSFNFTGYINVPADGEYTFYTTSDDGSNLLIDNILVVDNDGLHSELEKSGIIGLKAGKHAISAGFFQNLGDDSFSVNYKGPGMEKQLVPSSALYRISTDSESNLLPPVNPPNTINGLDYKYYQGDYYQIFPSFNLLTPEKTGTTSFFDISLADRTTLYIFKFTGYIDLPEDGQYTFYTTSDDGSNLFIDDVQVIDNNGLYSSLEKSGTIGLKAGKHAISVGYFQRWGESVLSVSYEGPGIGKQIIPSSALYRVSNSGVQSNLAQLNPVISNEPKAKVNVYPNPFSSSIEINITGVEKGELKMILLDASGKTIWNRNLINAPTIYLESINTSALAKGIYFLKIIQNDKSSEVKLLKQ